MLPANLLLAGRCAILLLMVASQPVSITVYRPDMASTLVDLWNRATDQRHPITAGLWNYCTEVDPYFRPEDGLVAAEGDRLLGFLLAKRYRGEDPSCKGFLKLGWIALMAVNPEVQHRGIGRRLLEEGERIMKQSDVSRIEVGGSFYHFTPGVPEVLSPSLGFFRGCGYGQQTVCWDVRRDLGDFRIPVTLDAGAATVHPFREGQEGELIALMRENGFPKRWAHDAQQFISLGGDIERFVGLWGREKAVGFAWIHPPGSTETLRWQGFDHTIAALGPIGVVPSERGKGLGSALLAVALQQLRLLGARATVIDWTDLLGFYGRLGFEPWIRYDRLAKEF